MNGIIGKNVLKSCGRAVFKRVVWRRLSTGFKHSRVIAKFGQWYKAGTYAPRSLFNTTTKSPLTHSAYGNNQSVKNLILSFVHRPYYYNYYVFKIRNNNHEA